MKVWLWLWFGAWVASAFISVWIAGQIDAMMAILFWVLTTIVLLMLRPG